MNLTVRISVRLEISRYKNLLELKFQRGQFRPLNVENLWRFENSHKSRLEFFYIHNKAKFGGRKWNIMIYGTIYVFV
jgi:hypothetical protein